MSGRDGGDGRRPQPPSNAGRRGGRPVRGQTPARPGSGPGPRRPGGLRLRQVGDRDFELDHPRCVAEMELDYAEGIDLWSAGDPEAARDALRFALQGCGDNMWVHVALGRIALEEFRDPALARGHFGYAFELAERALPPGFSARLDRGRTANRPLYEAIDGLAACYRALGKPSEAESLLSLAARLSGAR